MNQELVLNLLAIYKELPDSLLLIRHAIMVFIELTKKGYLMFQ
jgi:hypothetical protein